MLSVHRIKKALNPVHNTIPEDDFRILESWTETDDNVDARKAKMKYFCYKIASIDPETGKKNILYKAIKFARIDRLPKSARQSTSFMDMQTQVLSSVYEQGYNLITLIANVIRPTAEGLMYLYGVQGVSDDLDEAKRRADSDFLGFVGSMLGTFRVLQLHTITAEEGAWLAEKMRAMKYMTAVRGIPKANTAGEDMGNKGIGGTNLNPDSQGTLEEIITAMADYEYVIEILSTPVYQRTLMAWNAQTQKQMTEWYGQLQGTKSLNFNLSIPMTYMTSTGNSQGWSKNYTDSNTVSYTHGESYTKGYSENVGNSISQSLGESFGLSKGNSVTDSTSQSHSISQGVTKGQTVGITEGITRGQTIGQTIGYTQGITKGYTQGITRGESSSLAMSQSYGNSLGSSVGSSRGVSLGQSSSESMNQSYSSGVSRNESNSSGSSSNIGQSFGSSLSQSMNKSYGESSNVSHSTGVNTSDSYGTSKNQSVGGSHTDGTSQSVGTSDSVGRSYNKGNSTSTSLGFNTGNSVSGSNSESNGFSAGLNIKGVQITPISHNNSSGTTMGSSNGLNSGTNQGYSESSGTSASHGTSTSNGTSSSDGSSWGVSTGSSQSHSAGTSESYSAGQGTSYSEGYGASYGTTQGLSYSNGQSSSHSSGIGTSNSASSGYGSSTGKTYGENAGTSQSQNVGQSYSASISQNKGTSLSSSMSQSVSQSESVSRSNSQSESLSRSYSQSNSESVSQSQSESTGTSTGRSIGQSESESYTQSVSNGTGQSWGSSNSVSNGESYGSSEGKSTGTSIGNTGSYTTGTSGSMGLGPSIGYSKSYQWLDQTVKDILELLEYQNERLKKALRGNGAFYVYAYIACPDLDALSVAQAAAKSTWQNEYALTQPIQVLDLRDEEQQHLLYHFRAFSADVTRENIEGVSDYKYATVLLPNEYVAYTHLPRVSEGGIDTNIDDVPKFRVPGLMRGNIYMGTQLNSERYTFKSGYRTQFDYRINIDELMHGVFTGASRSGKTVAAMRFIRELANSRRTATGKRLRIVIMDPKQDWRGIARFVEPERFRFYSLGNTHFHPISLNPCKIPYGVEPQHWIDGIINIYCRAYGLLERGKQMLSDVFYELYTEAGVFPANGESFDEEYMAQFDDWKAEISKRSAKVTFHKLYKKMDHKNKEFSGGGKRAGNDTLDAYSRLLERLSCFARAYSIEYRLFSQEDRFEDINSTGLGLAVDELIGADDVTVFESFGLESTFANFIFGIITSGFYKFAKGFERGYLNPSQYETVLVIEEANKVLTGNDTAGTGSSGMASLSGQSEFEEILDQSAGYGLFIIAITQKISMMPSSIVANCGMFFLGKISQPEDVDLAVRMIGREGRIDDRDVVKWLPKSPTGWFICRSNRGYDFRDAEPVLVQIEPLNNATISNAELDEILTKRNIVRTLAENTAKIRRAAAG